MKLGKSLLGEKLFASLMKATFYGHFVAGEDQHKIVPTLQRLRSFGVKPILDYSVEEDISQEEAEKREVEYVLFYVSIVKEIANWRATLTLIVHVTHTPFVAITFHFVYILIESYRCKVVNLFAKLYNFQVPLFRLIVIKCNQCWISCRTRRYI